MLEVKKYLRKPFEVQAIQVTADNLYDVAKWCQGDLLSTDTNEQYIKVRVSRVINERQTQAFVTDWVLYAGSGYKVYTAKAFNNSFELGELGELVTGVTGKADNLPLSAAQFKSPTDDAA